jgi:anthranilate synthase component 1
VVKDGAATVQAGAVIVADSEPASEYAESRHKANALLSAIDLAEQIEQGEQGESAEQSAPEKEEVAI